MTGLFDDWQAKGITSVLHEKKGGYANNTKSIYGLADKAEAEGVRIMVICGNAGKNLGDSMYDGTIYIGGEPASLGVDAVWAEITDLERNWLERKLRQYDLLPKSGIGHFRKIVAGKQLWNYDNLEPTEKKLVL